MQPKNPLTTEYSVAQTFNIPVPASVRVLGYSQPGPLTPAVDPNYRFRAGLLSDLLGWHKSQRSGLRDGLWLTGPMGSGKSSGVVQVAARLNINVVRVNGRRRLEMTDLIGHLTAVGGDVLFQDGPLTTAARLGAWLLLDEADLIEPGELAGLNTILDGGPLVIPENGGETVQPAPGFGVICTGNSRGSGDATGGYAGIQRMNGALMDRFWVIEVNYPDPNEEAAQIAAAVPDLPAAIVSKMVEVAGEVRMLFNGEGEGPALDLTFSTRTLIRWAYLTVQFKGAPQPMDHALKRALTQRAEPETAAAIHSILQRVCGGNP